MRVRVLACALRSGLHMVSAANALCKVDSPRKELATPDTLYPRCDGLGRATPITADRHLLTLLVSSSTSSLTPMNSASRSRPSLYVMVQSTCGGKTTSHAPGQHQAWNGASPLQTAPYRDG